MNSLLIAKNIIKRAFRRKKELLILTLLPIIIVGLMTVISNQETIAVTDIGYVNLDNGELGNTLINHLKGADDINLIALEQGNMENALNSKEISFSLLIPEDFSQMIKGNTKTSIVFYPGESELVYETVKQNVNQYISSLYVIHIIGDSSIMDGFTANLENPLITASYHVAGTDPEQGNIEGQLTSMGFVITFIMMLIFNTMGSLIEDKKRLTLARIFSHPVKEWEVVTGNLLGSLSLGMLQLIPILITLKIVFNIPWGKSFFAMALIFFSFLITTIGLGIGLAGIAKNKFNPTMIIATVVVPTSILGGAFVPATMLPDFINKIAYIVPQKWVMNSMENILRGEPLSAILPNLGVILMFGLAFATFGTKTLKPLND